MDTVPIRFTLWMRGDGDDPITEDASGANPVEKLFEAAKLKAALGTEAVTKETSRVNPATPPDWEESLTATNLLRKTAKNLVRENPDGSYLLRSPNGKWLMKYAADGELISGTEIPVE